MDGKDDDRISELMRMIMESAEEGDLDAAVFLSESFGDGTLIPEHPEDPYKADCLRCLNGDAEECWRFHLEGRKVARGFIQDADLFDGDVPTIYERISDGCYIVPEDDGGSCEVRFDTLDPLDVMYRHDSDLTLAKLSERASEGDGDAAFHYLRLGGTFSRDMADLSETSLLWKAEEARRILDMDRSGPAYDSLGEKIPEAVRDRTVHLMADAINADPSLGFMLAYWYLVGVNVPEDRGKALAFAVLSAEAGSEDAADLVAMLVDSPFPTDDVRGPPIEDMKKHLKICGKGMNEYGRACIRMRPYSCPSRSSMQEGIEWRIITNMTRSGYYGECYGDSVNDTGGYEDDTISIRPYNWGDGDPETLARPNFLFKPSGFNMEWYKYPWRGAEMSENLSVGEIRRIWRLCIDHLLTGRTFDAGDTDSFLKMKPYVIDVPDDLRGRVEKVCETAGKVEARRFIRRSTSFRGPEYDVVGADADRGKAPAPIDELKALLESRDRAPPSKGSI